MASYPVLFDIERPEKSDRIQLLLRVAILIVLSIFGILSLLNGLIWLGIPVLAAILISQKGADRYLAESPENMTTWLGYIVGFYAWLGLLTDKLPGSEGEQPFRFEVQANGSPSIGQALLRIIMVIPHFIVLAILGFVAAILIIVAAIMILIQESYPEGIFTFLRGVQRWNVRVLVYLASLVDEYPPFALDTGTETLALPASGSAPEPPAP